MTMTSASAPFVVPKFRRRRAATTSSSTIATTTTTTTTTGIITTPVSRVRVAPRVRTRVGHPVVAPRGAVIRCAVVVVVRLVLVLVIVSVIVVMDGAVDAGREEDEDDEGEKEAGEDEVGGGGGGGGRRGQHIGHPFSSSLPVFFLRTYGLLVIFICLLPEGKTSDSQNRHQADCLLVVVAL